MIHRPKLERECNYNTLMKRYNELLEEEGMGLDWNLKLHCLNRQQLITKYYYAFIETDWYNFSFLWYHNGYTVIPCGRCLIVTQFSLFPWQYRREHRSKNWDNVSRWMTISSSESLLYLIDFKEEITLHVFLNLRHCLEQSIMHQSHQMCLVSGGDGEIILSGCSVSAASE